MHVCASQLVSLAEGETHRDRRNLESGHQARIGARLCLPHLELRDAESFLGFITEAASTSKSVTSLQCIQS